jgi:hypothetical protein
MVAYCLYIVPTRTLIRFYVFSSCISLAQQQLSLTVPLVLAIALLPSLLQCWLKLLQSSVLKREVSLRTLGRLIGSTRYVIRPYLRYPR